jgi:hypothetical protein
MTSAGRLLTHELGGSRDLSPTRRNHRQTHRAVHYVAASLVRKAFSAAVR